MCKYMSGRRINVWMRYACQSSGCDAREATGKKSIRSFINRSAHSKHALVNLNRPTVHRRQKVSIFAHFARSAHSSVQYIWSSNAQYRSNFILYVHIVHYTTHAYKLRYISSRPIWWVFAVGTQHTSRANYIIFPPYIRCIYHSQQKIYLQINGVYGARLIDEWFSNKSYEFFFLAAHCCLGAMSYERKENWKSFS